MSLSGAITTVLVMLAMVLIICVILGPMFIRSFIFASMLLAGLWVAVWALSIFFSQYERDIRERINRK